MSLKGLTRVKDDKSPQLGGNLDAESFHIDDLEKRSSFYTYVFNYATIIGLGKPTQVSRGVYNGWSLPIYDSDNEELFACSCIPSNWDGLTNPIIYVGGWLDTANTDKNFKLEVCWEHTRMDGTEVMDTSENNVPVSQATGTAAQYTAFKLAFTIDLVGSSVLAGDALGMRIRRLAADSNEITGEFVVEGAILVYPSTVIGGTW